MMLLILALVGFLNTEFNNSHQVYEKKPKETSQINNKNYTIFLINHTATDLSTSAILQYTGGLNSLEPQISDRHR